MVLSALRRLRAGLGRTRSSVVGRISAALKREVYLTDAFLEEVEEILISSDVGVDAAVELTEGLGRRLRGAGAQATMGEVSNVLLQEVNALLAGAGSPAPEPASPVHVILMVGVNGVGKTTSIAKLARWHQEQGRKVLLAAGDTFRAAAVEQLSVWADRLKVDIVKQEMGADPAAVAFDALRHARAAGHDVVIIDTAGRLHTKEGLMRELEKIGRVVRKQIDDGPHETLLVLDATTGQNSISQAKLFHEAMELDGFVMTKLDGTAKGGVLLNLSGELKLPIHFIGVGEKAEDLQAFDPESFVEALISG